MESLILLLKTILNPILNFFGVIERKQQIKSDRIILLLNQTKIFDSKSLEEFLKEELNRKISLELKGVEFNKKELEIVEREIAKTGGKVKWFHIKEAQQYLYFENEKLKVNFNKYDYFFNWLVFSIGILTLLSITSVFILDVLIMHYDENKFTIIFKLIIFLVLFGIGLFTISLVSPFFSGRKIKKEIF